MFGDCEVLTSGSSAEFCISPMLPCIGDIDMMVCFNNHIAIPFEQMPPTELEPHFQDIVNVFEIIDSQQPGYVYLQPSVYFLMKIDSSRYVMINRESYDNVSRYFPRSGFAEIFESFKTSNNPRDFFRHSAKWVFQKSSPQSTLNEQFDYYGGHDCYHHGPALTTMPNTNFSNHYQTRNIDIVSCMHCHVWPPQAADWPTRSRTHGWPDPATIHVVVSKGCDMVSAVHPSCRQDEWMIKHQWRLSFSRAEVTLINSWTPVQQIVYHMLRFLMKHEVLSKTNHGDPDVPTLNNYHIKTLMLWACEQKPQSWWSGDYSLMKLCGCLLHHLCGCIADRRYQHYFIDNCNLVSHFLDASITMCNILKNVSNESFLLKWFVENYICKCVQFCWTGMSLFDNPQSINMLQRAAHDVIDVQLMLKALKWEHFIEIKAFEQIIHTNVFSSRLCLPKVMKNELRKVNVKFHEYFVAVSSLSVSYKISMQSLTNELLELLWTLFDPCNEQNITRESGIYLSIRKAVKLATLPSVCSNAIAMLHNEMSKAYLHQTLNCEQESADCVVVAHILLASLYYKSGHYVKAIDHCKQILNKGGGDQCASRTIRAEFLPRIDDSIDTTVGLVLLYQYMQKNVTNVDETPQPMKKLAFTTELVAHYLYSRCSALTYKNNKLTMYSKQLCQTRRLLVSDILLFKIMKPQEATPLPVVVQVRTNDTVSNTLSSMDTTLMVTALELVALEKLTTVRQEMVRELYSNEFPVLNEFEPLYAYKCGLFEECLKMCWSNVDILLRSIGVVKLQPYLIAFPELLCLLDGELVSLCGILRLLQPNWMLMVLNFPGYCDVSLLTLSLYMITQCLKKISCVSYNETFETIRFVHDNMIFAGTQLYSLDLLSLKMTYRLLKLHSFSRCAD